MLLPAPPVRSMLNCGSCLFVYCMHDTCRVSGAVMAITTYNFQRLKNICAIQKWPYIYINIYICLCFVCVGFCFCYQINYHLSDITSIIWVGSEAEKVVRWPGGQPLWQYKWFDCLICSCQFWLLIPLLIVAKLQHQHLAGIKWKCIYVASELILTSGLI